MNDTNSDTPTQSLRRGTAQSAQPAPITLSRARHSIGLPAHDSRGVPYPEFDTDDLPADIVLPRLKGVSGDGPTWYALCPAHPDSRPSLSITEADDHKLLIYCHAGCTTKEVMADIGLDLRFLFPSAYALECGTCMRRFGAGPRMMSTQSCPISEPNVDYARFDSIVRMHAATSQVMSALAEQLRLPVSSLLALGVCYDAHASRWVFPERDAERRVVGITYRYRDGSKICESGGKRGLSIPSDIDQRRAGPVYLAEGASDTAALHAVGLSAIGRPAAEASAIVRLWLTQILRKYADRPVIVVGDRDAIKAGKSAGCDGARNLANYLKDALARPIGWALPAAPHKDVRDQIVAGEWLKGLELQEVLR